MSREKDETICIGKSVQIVVVEVRGGKVRLGIQAPTALPVHRGEVVLVEAARQLDETLTTQAAREFLRGLAPKARAALLKQLLDEEICTGCGCHPLRCLCHGDCVGRAAPAAESSTPALAGAAP